jgi:hypothetical protein
MLPKLTAVPALADGQRPGVEGWSTIARVVGAFRGTVVPFSRLPAEWPWEFRLSNRAAPSRI